jgi:hypothetical protein
MKKKLSNISMNNIQNALIVSENEQGNLFNKERNRNATALNNSKIYATDVNVFKLLFLYN